MLQCVAVCCSVLQCVAVCCSVLQCVAVCGVICMTHRDVTTRVIAVSEYSGELIVDKTISPPIYTPLYQQSAHHYIKNNQLTNIYTTLSTISSPQLQCVAVCCSVLQCVAVCRSVLQCVAVCCSVLQCVAVC